MQWLIIPIVIVVGYLIWSLNSAERQYRKLLNSRELIIVPAVLTVRWNKKRAAV